MVRLLEAGNVLRKVHVVDPLDQLAVPVGLGPPGHDGIRQGLVRLVLGEPVAVRHDIELEPFFILGKLRNENEKVTRPLIKVRPRWERTSPCR